MALDLAYIAQRRKWVIENFGKTVTITYVTPGTYDPDTGKSTPGTTTANVKATVRRYERGEFGDLIRAGDLEVTVSALGITAPDQNSRVTIDGLVHDVLRVDPGPPNSGDTPATYIMQARR